MRSTTWNEVCTRYTTSTARTVSYQNYHGERRLLAHADRRPEVSSYAKSSGKLVNQPGAFYNLQFCDRQTYAQDRKNRVHSFITEQPGSRLRCPAASY